MKKLAPFAETVLPWLSCVAMLAALGMIFVYVPTERNLGVVQRIFYYHLPAAWNAFAGFVIVAGASVSFLWKGERRADLLARAAAEVGMVFCTLFIVTGSVWAKASWGVWWTWDPRLTMTLVLWVVYAAYVLLRQVGGDTEHVARYAAVLGLVGVVNIPLIYISIRLWRGIHPRVESMAPSMAWTLLVCSGAFVVLFAWLLWLRLRSLHLTAELGALRRQAWQVWER